MKKNNKKISSSDLKLWNQILDKVEPIKKSGRSKIINQKESVIEDNIIIQEISVSKILSKKGSNETKS